jgi:hypothetical protein
MSKKAFIGPVLLWVFQSLTASAQRIDSALPDLFILEPRPFTDGESRPVKINLYNSDISRQFRIIVEGFDSKERLSYLEKIVE